MKTNSVSKKAQALFIALVMVFALLPTFVIDVSAAPAEYEWWDLRGYEEDVYVSTVANTSAPFGGWRDLVGTYDGNPLSVRHYWAWYAENPNSTRQRIDIYVPSQATSTSPVLHMVNNVGWVVNDYPYNGTPFGPPVYDDETHVFLAGNNSLQNALNRGYVVMTNGARTYGSASLQGEEYAKSPATVADYKAALRFLRANMGPDMAIDVGNPDLVFVTGMSGGGAMSDILGASGNSPDYFGTMYDIGTLGLEWKSTVPFKSATLAQKTNMANWTDTLSDSYMGVAAWCPMDDFAMGEQGMAWFFAEKRWAQTEDQPNDAYPPITLVPVDTVKTPELMLATNQLALEFIDYVNALGLKDELGATLSATYTVKPTPAQGGVAGGNFLDATVRLMEKGVERAISNWAAGDQEDFDVASFAVTDALDKLWTDPLVDGSVLINGDKPSESIMGVPAGSLPVNPTVEITDRVNYLLGLNPTLAKGSIFPYSSPGAGPGSGVLPFQPDDWDVMADTSGMYGTDSQPNTLLNRVAWNSFSGPAATYPGAGNKITGVSWDNYLKTPDGQAHALQMKMASSIPYLNADNLSAVPYLKDAGFYGSDIANPAKYWFVRYGMNDQQISYAMLTTLYYSLMNNPVVDFDMSEVIPFNWNKGHDGGYENIFRWIEECAANYYANTPKPITPTMPVNPFADVVGTDWFIDDVIYAYSKGLIEGTTPTTFAPKSNLTNAQAVTLAARMHQLYTNGEVTLINGDDPWYQPYVDYAIANGIISDDDYDWNAAATRAGYVAIFANALPDEAFAELNDVVEGFVPDVAMTHPQADAIYKLYRAGILQGNDTAYTFNPEANIQRSEVAAILTRMMNPEARIEFDI